MNLFYSILLFIIAQGLVWFQVYAPLKIPWFQHNQWLAYAMALPITYLFILATKLGYESTGEAWSNRFIMFSCGIIIFAILTSIFFKEPINLKVTTSIILSLSLIAIQLFWK